MKFQIESLKLDDKFIELSRPTYDDNNVYTMIVGRNSSGKTRTLSKVANHYIFKGSHSEPDDVRATYNSLYEPRQVIAVSNSRFDRFPDPSVMGKSDRLSDVGYHYLGLAGSKSSPYNIISKSIGSIINEFNSNSIRSRSLSKILNYIGFMPSLNIDFRIQQPHFSRSGGEKIYSFSLESMSSIRNNDKYEFKIGPYFEDDLRDAMDYVQDRLHRIKTFSLNLDLINGWWGGKFDSRLIEYLPILLDNGLVKVTKLVLYNHHSKDKMAFHHASSGQQCMILMFLGLAGLIQDNSLICIDEPEISLHPKWQREFIEILQEAFFHYKGCHFLIATHSPQIVAGLDSHNGFVSDLEQNNLLESADYSKKSSDFQLSEVFHEPGFKNEYLIRNLLLILGKITKYENLSREDWNKIEHIETLQDRLDPNDPVLHLFRQIKTMAR